MKIGDIGLYSSAGLTYRSLPFAIWCIIDIIDQDGFTDVELRNIGTESTFITDSVNFFKWEDIPEKSKEWINLTSRSEKKLKDIYKLSIYKESSVKPNKENKTKTNKENKVKTKMKSRNESVIDSNIDAAKVAAKLTLGKTLNKALISKVKGQLPFYVRSYADGMFGDVVAANIANFAIQNFASDNRKAVYAADAMLQAAMLEFANQFNLDKIITEMLDGVSLPEVDTA